MASANMPFSSKLYIEKVRVVSKSNVMNEMETMGGRYKPQIVRCKSAIALGDNRPGLNRFVARRLGLGATDGFGRW